jgi:Na+(H+)/acetate symporter ActP
MFLLGVLIAIGAAIAFAVVGALTLWGGLDAVSSELPRDFRRSAATPAQRAFTVAIVALPLVITALFGLLAAGRILQVAFGLG